MSTHATDKIIAPHKIAARRAACELDCQVAAITSIQSGLERCNLYRSWERFNGTYLTSDNALPILKRYAGAGWHVVHVQHNGELRFIVSAVKADKRELDSMLYIYASERAQADTVTYLDPPVNATTF